MDNQINPPTLGLRRTSLPASNPVNVNPVVLVAQPNNMAQPVGGVTQPVAVPTSVPAPVFNPAPVVSPPNQFPEGMSQLPVSTDQVKITTTSGSGRKLSGLFKLALLILLPIGLAVGGALTISRYFAESSYQQARGVLLAIPMKETNWQDLGMVFEPLVTIAVKTTTGLQNNQFLLDSGAVVSSLPRDWAEKTGQDLAFLPRSNFRGFGGATSFAYQGEMNVMLGEREINLPVVFTEASGTKSLLGRKGFFENYSIYFNHKEKQIEIRE